MLERVLWYRGRNWQSVMFFAGNSVDVGLCSRNRCGNFKCDADDELIPSIDHANVACGFHAGHVQGPAKEGSLR